MEQPNLPTANPSPALPAAGALAPSPFSRKLLALRDAGFTNRQLGVELGVTPMTVSKWASGQSEPRADRRRYTHKVVAALLEQIIKPAAAVDPQPEPAEEAPEQLKVSQAAVVPPEPEPEPESARKPAPRMRPLTAADLRWE